MPDPNQPAAPFQFFVPMLRSHSGYLHWISANGVGVEIQDLFRPSTGFFSQGRPEDCRDFWRKTLEGSSIPVSLHGPAVMDLLYKDESREEGLQELTRAMDVAAAIGARHFITHAGLGALPEGVKASGLLVEVWKAVLLEAKARDLVLLLENTDEKDPVALRELRASIGSPGFGLCLDVGHALRHSPLTATEWLEALGSDVLYVHLYNTTSSGEEHHGALGNGEIDIEGFLRRLGGSKTLVPVCLEMDVSQILASVPWLTQKGLLKAKKPQEDLF